jgi:hypothetical protein
MSCSVSITAVLMCTPNFLLITGEIIFKTQCKTILYGSIQSVVVFSEKEYVAILVICIVASTTVAMQ